MTQKYVFRTKVILHYARISGTYINEEVLPVVIAEENNNYSSSYFESLFVSEVGLGKENFP